MHKAPSTRNHVALEIGFWTSTQVRRLKLLLLDPAGGMYLARLREYVYLNGDIEGNFFGDAEAIAWGCEYVAAAPEKLVDALQKALIIKPGRRRGSWVYIGWKDLVTGRFLHTKAVDAARQRDLRELRRQQKEALEMAENARKLGEKTQNGEKLHGNIEGVTSADVRRKKEIECNLSPPTPSRRKTGSPSLPTQRGTEEEGECFALWAWFWKTYPKQCNPVKCKRLFLAQPLASLQRLKAHVIGDILKRKPQFQPIMINYLENQEWLSYTAKPVAVVVKPVVVVETADDSQLAARIDAEWREVNEVRKQLEAEGLRGRVLQQRVDEVIEQRRRN